jgi:thiol-disulfide isomerase/thioredoxin
VLKDVKKIDLNIVFWNFKSDNIFKEISMERSGNKFSATVKLPNDSVVYITYKFVSDNLKDDNNGNWWETFIFDKKGKIREGSYFQKYLSYTFHMDLERKKDDVAAFDALKKEIELHKNYFPALSKDWINRVREAKGKDKELDAIKKEINKSYELGKTDEEALGFILNAAEYAGMIELSDKIREYILKNNPKSKTSLNIRLSNLTKETNLEKKLSGIKNFLQDFPTAPGQILQYLFVSSYDIYVQQRMNDEIKDILRTKVFDNPYYVQKIVITEIGRSENIKEAAKYVANNINYLESNLEKIKPGYLSLKNWKIEAIGMKSRLLGMQGKLLFKMGELQSSQKSLAEAFSLSRAEDNDINVLYVKVLVNNKYFEKAMEVSTECVRKGKYNNDLVKNWEIAYSSTKGSNVGFKEILTKIENEQLAELKKKISSKKINKPAPDFQLKDLSGNSVKLTDLKGKVILVDFWATWCGPCKSSFPFLQKAYEKYQNNENVKFFAIDTWERVASEEREKIVKKFLQENKYTFPVLYDDESNGTVGKYEVSGIPTKFMIDKEGKIQFMSVGFDKGEEMMKEIDIWIELLTK